MNFAKELYEAPEVEEIVFASLDAIAASNLISGDDNDEDQVGDDWFGF